MGQAPGTSLCQPCASRRPHGQSTTEGARCCPSQQPGTDPTAQRRGPPQGQPRTTSVPLGVTQEPEGPPDPTCSARSAPASPPGWTLPGTPTLERHAPIPGTRMSPKPSREKGRSHRASGEAFSLGTFRTMGSWGREEAAVSGTRPSPPLSSRQRLGRGPATYLLVGG